MDNNNQNMNMDLDREQQGIPAPAVQPPENPENIEEGAQPDVGHGIIRNERIDPERAFEHVAGFLPPEHREDIRVPVEDIAQEGNRVIDAFEAEANDFELDVRDRDARIEILEGQLAAARVQNRPDIEVPIELVRINPNVGEDRLANVPLQDMRIPLAILEYDANIQAVLENALRPGVDLDQLVGRLDDQLARQIINYLNGSLNHVNGQFVGALENLDAFIQLNNAGERNRLGLLQTIDALRHRLEDRDARLRALEENNPNVERNVPEVHEEVRELHQGAEERPVVADEQPVADLVQHENLVVLGFKQSWAGSAYSLDCAWDCHSIRPRRVTCQIELGGVHKYIGYGPVVKVLTRQGAGEASVGLRGISDGTGFRPFLVSHAGVSMPVPKAPRIRGQVMADVVIPLDEIRLGKPISPVTETHLTGSVEFGCVHGSTVRLGHSLALGSPHVNGTDPVELPAQRRSPWVTPSGSNKGHSFGVVSMVQPAPMPQSRPSVGVVGLSCLCIVSAVWIVLKRRFRA